MVDARVLPRGYGRPTITYSRVQLWYLTRNSVPRSRASLSRLGHTGISVETHRRGSVRNRKLRDAGARVETHEPLQRADVPHGRVHNVERESPSLSLFFLRVVTCGLHEYEVE